MYSALFSLLTSACLREAIKGELERKRKLIREKRERKRLVMDREKVRYID